MARAIVVGSIVRSPTKHESEVLRTNVDWLRVRADRLSPIECAALKDHFRGPTIFSLESHRGETTAARQRVEKLVAAASRYDLIELDAERDLVGEVLDAVAPERRIVRWCGPARDWRVLQEHFRRLSLVPAKYYVFATEPSRNGEELATLYNSRPGFGVGKRSRRARDCRASWVSRAWRRPLSAICRRGPTSFTHEQCRQPLYVSSGRSSGLGACID